MESITPLVGTFTPLSEADVRELIRERDEARGLAVKHVRTIERLARGLVREGNNLRDHTCRRCFPRGPRIVEGFVCAYHEAESIVSRLPGSDTGSRE